MDTVTQFSEVKVDRKYRRRTVDEKRQIVEETLSSGRPVADVSEQLDYVPGHWRVRPIGQAIAAYPVPGCSRMFWSPNSVTICPCTDCQ
jgi:hypothetical protein